MEGTQMKHGQTHGGKGSTRRNVDDKAYADNWEKIFGKKPKEEANVEYPQRTNVNNRAPK